jgi:cation transport ATPase
MRLSRDTFATAQVKESIELKREQIKEEARLKQQKAEARIKATQSFFQQQADDAKASFETKMKENEKKRQDFERRRDEEVAQRKERAERKAAELIEVCFSFFLCRLSCFRTPRSQLSRRCKNGSKTPSCSVWQSSMRGSRWVSL